jgi:2-amino-1-hydroxyethylphosphonate dioxygenase (glycine-forming)
MDKMEVLEEIKTLYLTHGKAKYIGEPLTTNEHMVEAALLAENDRESNQIILGAFFHDIGHYVEGQDMNGYGIMDHDQLGYQYLISKGFDESIAILVKNHVKAKKYLVSKSEEYYQSLSEASKMTLTFQGGKMTEEEMSLFEQDPYFENSIKIRHLDDRSKIPNFIHGPIESHIDKYLKLASSYIKK